MVRDGGRILLLEHGRSTYEWLNNVLDADAADRYSIWGCWWNRDMVQIVQEAGLEVQSLSRWHFGTTICVVARVQKQPATDSVAVQ